MSSIDDYRADALALIEEEYQSILNTNSIKRKAYGYSAIIQTKTALALTSKPEMYTDIKGFIRNYILYFEHEAYNYDTVVFSKIVDSVVLNDESAALNLYKYALKLLKSNGYDEQAKECEQKIRQITEEVLKKKTSITNLIHRFYLFTTRSANSIAVSLLMSVFISTVILLPSYSDKLACMQYSTCTYSSFPLLNRILNTIVLMTGIDDSVKIKPINTFGVFLMLVGKGFFLLIIANILFKQFKSRFNLE